MKSFLTTPPIHGILAILSLATLAGCAGTAVPVPPADISGPGPGHFESLWTDEFDQVSVDTRRWIVMDRHEKWWPESPWRRNYKASNVVVHESMEGARGVLEIRTVKETDSQGKDSWSTGCIQTKDGSRPALFEQAFGRFEARVRFPSRKGHWCAFWIMNDRANKVGNQGRDGSEIDIMEKSRLSDLINHALHWDGYGSAHRSEGHDVTGMGLDDGGWHEFRVDWYPDRYVFFVDGTETWRTDAGGVSQTPGFLILSEEIGNFGEGPDAWGGGPIAAETLPDTFLVDWVRVSRWVADKSE